jgi:hypothetical protein
MLELDIKLVDYGHSLKIYLKSPARVVEKGCSIGIAGRDGKTCRLGCLIVEPWLYVWTITRYHKYVGKKSAGLD